MDVDRFLGQNGDEEGILDEQCAGGILNRTDRDQRRRAILVAGKSDVGHLEIAVVDDLDSDQFFVAAGGREDQVVAVGIGEDGGESTKTPATVNGAVSDAKPANR